MWNAFEKVKSAASKLGNEVSEVLDKLTEEEPEDKKQERLRREEEVKKKKKEDLERRKAGLQFRRDRAKELEGKINAWQVSFEAEHGRKPTTADIEANPEIYITHEEHAALAKELNGIPNMAAEKVVTWITKASEEVSKAVHSGVDAFHDFVEQSKQETQDDTHKLLKAIGHIDALESKTKELQDIDVLRKDAGSVTQKHLIEVKNQVHVTWEDIEDGYFSLLSTLNALAKSEDEAVGQRVKEQIARVEELLKVGDKVLEQLSTLSKTTYVFSDDTGLMKLNNLEVKETKDRCVIESEQQGELEAIRKPGEEKKPVAADQLREAVQVKDKVEEKVAEHGDAPVEAGRQEKEAAEVQKQDEEARAEANAEETVKVPATQEAAPSVETDVTSPPADGPPAVELESVGDEQAATSATPDKNVPVDEQPPTASATDTSVPPSVPVDEQPPPSTAPVTATTPKPDDDDDPFADIDTPPTGTQAGKPPSSAEKKDANPFEWDNEWDLS